MISAAWMSADPKLVEHAIREEEKKAKEMEKKLEGYLVETGVRRQYFHVLPVFSHTNTSAILTWPWTLDGCNNLFLA